MPYFTRQMTGGAPILNAFVGVSAARHAALQAASQPIPQPIPIVGLVDTGASGTCVDPSVLTALGLTPTGVVMVNSPTTGTTPQPKDQYDIRLVVPTTPTQVPLIVNNLPVLCSELYQAQGIHALIGRDILSVCHLTYDGLNGFFSVAY